MGGGTLNSEGVFQTVAGQPVVGEALLVLLAAGLAAYSMWRSVQVITDIDDHGNDLKGMAIRAFFAVSAVVYMALAVVAISTLLGSSDGGSKDPITWLMSHEWGKWVVGVGGSVVIGLGIAQLYRAWHAKFEKRMKIPSWARSWVRSVSRAGLVTRGIAFAVSGSLAIAIAVGFNAETGGTSRVLEVARDNNWGAVPLGLMALGLICFGLYGFFMSAWRRVKAHKVV